MLTNNYYAILSAISFRYVGLVFANARKPDGTIANIYHRSGTGYYNYPFDDSTPYFYTAPGMGYICLGSGTTPATLDDYALENMITSGFTANGTAVFVRYGEKYVERVVKTVITNTSGATLTISEIGYFGRAYFSNSNSGGGPILTDRTVLDEPIVIPATESRTLEYVIRFNFPT